MAQPPVAPPPHPRTRSGVMRRVGVEIEFGGLDEDAAAAVAQRVLGGRIEPDGAGLRLRASRLGEVQIYLDTAWRSGIKAIEPKGVERVLERIARLVVPVEIVTEPLAMDGLGALDRLGRALAAAGARGSGASPLAAYGIHFNPEIRGPDLAALLGPMRAHALAERALRQIAPPDISRRATPFIRPWPEALVEALLEAPPATLGELAELYLRLAPSRNHGLDMLPALAELCPQRVAARLGEGAVSARPAFHFRLPECRLGEAGWRITAEWRKWVAIERLAEADAALAEMAQVWRAGGAGRDAELARLFSPFLEAGPAGPEPAP